MSVSDDPVACVSRTVWTCSARGVMGGLGSDVCGVEGCSSSESSSQPTSSGLVDVAVLRLVWTIYGHLVLFTF